jgi:molecular chaperone GrpE (heat shock protein)
MDYPTETQELDWREQIDNLTDTLDNVKRELNRKLALANKYGYDEYADELARLLEKLDAFRKARK